MMNDGEMIFVLSGYSSVIFFFFLIDL